MHIMVVFMVYYYTSQSIVFIVSDPIMQHFNIPGYHEQVPYCTEPVSIDQPDSSNVNGAKPQGVAGAWVQTTKMWGRRDVLFIHFLNPEVLQEWEVGDAAMNIDNILSWAEAWNNTLVPDIPTFEKTDSARKADIRVNFGGKGSIQLHVL